MLHLDIADSSDGKTAVDIKMLIGADYYWDLTTDHICRGESGPIVIQTKLGCMDLVWACTDWGKRSLYDKVNDSA